MQRPHPLHLYYDIKIWLLLLLLPVLRAVFYSGDTVSVILSSIRDVALAAALTAYSAVKWRKSGFLLKNGLIISRGLIIRRLIRVAAKHAASIETERSPLMWLAGGRRVRINTAGLKRRADATVYMPAGAAELLTESGGGSARRVYSRVLPVLALSASSSNAAIGFLTLAPALRQAGQIIGREVSGGSTACSTGLSRWPASAAQPSPTCWCWAGVFVRAHLRRAAGFAASRKSPYPRGVGLLNVRDTYIDCARITAVELRQTLFMRLFGLYTVTITAAGCRREKGAPGHYSAARRGELRDALDTLLPGYPPAPPRRALPALAGRAFAPLLLTAGSLIRFTRAEYGGRSPQYGLRRAAGG